MDAHRSMAAAHFLVGWHALSGGEDVVQPRQDSWAVVTVLRPRGTARWERSSRRIAPSRRLLQYSAGPTTETSTFFHARLIR